MQISQLFKRPIDRPIAGVIHAEDATVLGDEVKEYVLTNEAAKQLESLLEEYTNYQNANGVWISGFYGSGKSHLLKMLAHLLGEDPGQPFPREKVEAEFLTKAEGNEFLQSLIKKADRIPATSLLFNIDQKAATIDKNQKDALFKVFVKVFNEARGYFGNQGHVAKFESDLETMGRYQAFQDAFERITGKPWVEARKLYLLQSANIDRAFAEVTGDNVTGIIKQYADDYKLSIDDFADEVAAWLATKEPNHRLNFFADEVGQFIGTDTSLMLNLQTIAESLNTKCHGRAWVFVTAQEDMDKVVGDRSKAQANDFSKIQARFAVRVKLTSRNVEEVIRKRLLEKTPEADRVLAKIYDEESGNFKTIFDFADGGRHYKNYTDADTFMGTYPFVNYQFPLFHDAIKGISDHNLFEGRAQSVGERSMLDVVQQVAKRIGNGEIGALASFDQFFSGIQTRLLAAPQKAIFDAEANLDDPLAIRLLKALFLVKYVPDFKASARNLAVLLYDKFGSNVAQLSKDVAAALAELERQSYIQRNGDVYEYLSNEEQDVENEIKAVDIESSEVLSALEKIFGDIIKTPKIRYSKNGQDFPFGYKIDDQQRGRGNQELTIHFVTPEFPDDLEMIRLHSHGRDELRIVLAPDDRAFADLRLMLKTKKYVSRNSGTSLSESRREIVTRKGARNAEREREVASRIAAAVGKSTLVVNGIDIDSNASDAFGHVADGFQKLVAQTYPRLADLGSTRFTEDDISRIVNPDPNLLVPNAIEQQIIPAAEEVLAVITQRDRAGEQVTVKTLLDHFSAKPYGWDWPAIECAIAYLARESRVQLETGGNPVKRAELPSTLKSTTKHPITFVSPQKIYDPNKVAALRQFAQNFFDQTPSQTDPAELAKHVADQLTAKGHELQSVSRATQYPIGEQLQPVISRILASAGKPADWYFASFDGNELLDDKENLIDAVERFINSDSQKRIYDDAVNLLRSNENNLIDLPEGAADPVRNLLVDPNFFRKLTQLKNASQTLQGEIDQAVTAARSDAIAAIERIKAGLIASAAYEQAPPADQAKVSAAVTSVIQAIEGNSQIAQIKTLADRFDSQTYPWLLDQLQPPTTPVEQPNDIPVDGETPDTPTQAPRRTVSISSLSVGKHATIESERDVEEYLDLYRKVLLDAISDGKRITY